MTAAGSTKAASFAGVALEAIAKVLGDPHDGLSGGGRTHILAQEIVDDLRSALGQIEDVLADLEARSVAGIDVAQAPRPA